ncbi:response regulator [Parvularcula dongshanensis]|uniref:DNA-binding response OmpR family regulator n=1 Tax=Parvularcula dongshanensis TaxID=1173995 RepID=A0A840I323_9PROT|nr:response regulator [Parvularcula dongshanensis]MBB4659167.1 DNA-binding response OmpR family regulator [Parvularcula dongshanensis]
MIDPAPTRAADLVLVVEDEPMTAMLLAQAVKDRGLDVVGPHRDANTARAAVEKGGLAAALLDVSLDAGETSAPVADALAAAGVPFAFVTGYGTETAQVVRAHPERLVIPKPVDRETLGILLDELLPAGIGSGA